MTSSMNFMRYTLLASFLFLSGCASIPKDTSAIANSIVPIDQSYLEVKKDLTFLPSLSGFSFPSGIYLPVARDESGVFYQSPKGIKMLALVSTYYPIGGIYRFRKSDGSYGLKSWRNAPKTGYLDRELYDMVWAHFDTEVVFHASR